MMYLPLFALADSYGTLYAKKICLFRKFSLPLCYIYRRVLTLYGLEFIIFLCYQVRGNGLEDNNYKKYIL